MADTIIVSLILIPILIILILSACIYCWKGHKPVPFYSFNKKYYLKSNNGLIEMKTSAIETCNSHDDNHGDVNKPIQSAKLSSDNNLLDSTDDKCKEFEHSVLQIDDNSEPNVKRQNDEDTASCGSLESSKTFYSIYTNRRISTISGVTVYLDVE